MNVSIFTHHIRNRACGLCEFEASSGFTSSTPGQAKLVMEDGGVKNATSPTRRQSEDTAYLQIHEGIHGLQNGYQTRNLGSNRIPSC